VSTLVQATRCVRSAPAQSGPGVHEVQRALHGDEGKKQLQRERCEKALRVAHQRAVQRGGPRPRRRQDEHRRVQYHVAVRRVQHVVQKPKELRRRFASATKPVSCQGASRRAGPHLAQRRQNDGLQHHHTHLLDARKALAEARGTRTAAARLSPARRDAVCCLGSAAGRACMARSGRINGTTMRIHSARGSDNTRKAATRARVPCQCTQLFRSLTLRGGAHLGGHGARHEAACNQPAPWLRCQRETWQLVSRATLRRVKAAQGRSACDPPSSHACVGQRPSATVRTEQERESLWRQRLSFDASAGPPHSSQPLLMALQPGAGGSAVRAQPRRTCVCER